MRLASQRPIKTLDFDIENRPLSYWRPDRPTAEVTAIAFGWVGQPRSIHAVVLGEVTADEMLERFVEAYDEADMVTGHYIRRHDLPIINGALLELGLPPLQAKLTQDTRLDLMRLGDLPASQEELSEMLGVKAAKFRMSQTKWRQANRLTEEGLALTRKRVMDDVRQHMGLRQRLLDLDMLGTPKVWTP